MSINLQLPKSADLKPRITVIGVGGAGGNAINNMISSGLDGVEYIVANTDAQALAMSSAERRIQLGVNLTEGLGAGSRPEIGEAAAQEAVDDISSAIAGSHMVFIAAGMGGGTGTGAAGVIARIAKDLDILTVGIVTRPFQFEGTRRARTADVGIAELKKYVDTLIVIPNQNLFRVATEKTTFADAFRLADQVLYAGVACIVDLIVKDGLINLDFADVRTVMTGMGSAMMGTGEASGESRATLAAEEAISNPLLDDITLKGARGLLLSIIGGNDMTHVGRLVKAPIAWISVSVDAATPETYAKIRGSDMRKTVDGARRLAAALGALRRNDAGTVAISMVLMRENIHEAPLFVELARDVGASTVYFEHLTETHTPASEWTVIRDHFRFNYAEQSLRGEPRSADPHIIKAMDVADRLGIFIWGPEILLDPSNLHHLSRPCRTGAFSVSQ